MDKPAATLLGLPIKIRSMILRHLLPDHYAITFRPKEKSHRPAELAERAQYRKKLQGHFYHFDMRPFRAPFGKDGQTALFKVHKSRLWRRRDRTAHRLRWDLAKEVGKVYKSFRFDLESCWPAVLRVNRQLHDEGVHLIYQQCQLGHGVIHR